MPLTQEEQIELQQLELLVSPAQGLTIEEEKELSQLEALDAGQQIQPEALTLGQRLEERVKKAIPPSPTSAIEAAAFPTRAGIRAGGQLIGGIGDIIAEGAKKAFTSFVPEQSQETLKSIGTSIGQLMAASSESLTPEGLATKTGIQALQGGFEFYQSFKAQNPEIATDIESVLNIASAFPVSKIGGPVIKESFDIAGDITNFTTRKSIKNLDNQITKTVNQRFPKAVLPKTAGRKTPTQIKRFQAKSRDSVENIIANKDNLRFIDESGQEVIGRLPQNLDEFGQAITQTKAKIFNDFDALAKMAGDKGAKVNTAKISQELRKIADDSRIQRLTPSTAQEANRLADSYDNVISFNPLDAEEELEVLNRTLKSFYDSPSPDSASVAYVHSLVANNIRKQLDDVISSSTGGQFQELKNAYGSLRSIEEDVGGAIFREAKKGNPGLVVDFGNVLSSTAALQGILTSNPQLAIAAGAGKIVVDTFKKLREPSRLINKMFTEVDSTIIKRNDLGFNPRSKLGTHLKGRITKSQREGILTEQRRSVSELGQAPQAVSERGFTISPQETTPLSIPKKKPFTKPAISIEPKTQVGKLTGDQFIDSKISIALSTPPFLRTAKQKLTIDLITVK